MAERKSGNFEYFLGTYWEKYYEDLINCEIMFHNDTASKYIYGDCRAIAEDMAKKIKINEYGQSHGDTFDSYLCAIRDDLPQNIKKYFYRIKSNGNVALHPADEKEYTASPQKILEYLYECLRWYFKKFERITIVKAKYVIPYHEMS